MKKMKNPHFWHYFQPKRDEIGREGGKKILVPNFGLTRPGQEHSEKNTKKLQKVKKPLSGITFSQNEMRQAEKERKEFQSRIPFILNPCKKNSEKNCKKIQKIKKPLSGSIFSQNGMRQAEKERIKFQFRIPFFLGPGM